MAFSRALRRYTAVELVNRPDWQPSRSRATTSTSRISIPLHFDIDAAPYGGRPAHRARSRDGDRHHRLPSSDAEGQNRLGVSRHSRRRMWPSPRSRGGQNLPAAVRSASIPALHGVDGRPMHIRRFEIIGGLFAGVYRVARCGTADRGAGRRRDVIERGGGRTRAGGPFSEFTDMRRSVRPKTCSWPARIPCSDAISTAWFPE